ncbi:PAAR domain-containing protein [Streptomyces sp. NPDC001288]|uniref:PAAR domain-containing protein n=1 Tax=unclassified Streptomyces TaxID=2593676 RepID=UPI00332DDF0F
MSAPLAALGDTVRGVDTHIVLVPAPGGPVPTPYELPFSGPIVRGCCPTVLTGGRPVATVGSVAVNTPVHVPPVGTFQVPPDDLGTVETGSATVFVGGKPAARNEDLATTCNDPMRRRSSVVTATRNVFVG